MLKAYSKFLDRLQSVLRILAIILFITMFAAMFLQIATRVFFGKGFVWAEEAARFSMIWLSMLTLGLATRWAIHFKADFLYDIMPPKLCKAAGILVSLLQLLFIVVLFVTGIDYIGAAMGGLAPGMRIPMSYMYIAIPIGTAILFLYTVEYFFIVVLKGAGKGEKQWE